MANWDNINSTGDVIDSRGTSPGLAIGGGTALIGIVVFLALQYFGVNVDPGLISDVVNSGSSSQTTEQPAEYAGKDAYETFVSKVVGSTDEYWKTTLAQKNIDYPKPSLLLFTNATNTACGYATTAVGPFYCPSDQRVYLDTGFFDTLQQLGGSTKDVAQAYVIAHEIGHHVQNVTGTMEAVQRDPNYQRTGENSLSVRLELQADCYAGMWARSVQNQGIIEQSEIEQAIQTAGAVGDDRIQAQTQGQVTPETWTHGSAAERASAFNRGYEKQSLSACTL